MSSETVTEAKDNRKTLRFSSMDQKEFKVPVDVAKVSKLISQMLIDVGEEDDDVIPLPNVRAEILEKIFEWMEHHVNDPPKIEDDDDKMKPKVELTAWDQEFLDVDKITLFDYILAANYLDIKDLLDMACKAVANMITGKSVEEIRRLFHITNDFTPEEEEQIQKENEWCEEK